MERSVTFEQLQELRGKARDKTLTAKERKAALLAFEQAYRTYAAQQK
jgi:hypothetical protein